MQVKDAQLSLPAFEAGCGTLEQKSLIRIPACEVGSVALSASLRHRSLC